MKLLHLMRANHLSWSLARSSNQLLTLKLGHEHVSPGPTLPCPGEVSGVGIWELWGFAAGQSCRQPSLQLLGPPRSRLWSWGCGPSNADSYRDGSPCRPLL